MKSGAKKKFVYFVVFMSILMISGVFAETVGLSDDTKAIVKDIITKQAEVKKGGKLEFLKSLGVNIQEIKPEQEQARQESLEKATSAIKNKELPILNPQFKNLIKDRIMKLIAQGKSSQEIQADVKQWIILNIDELKKLKGTGTQQNTPLETQQ